MIATAIGPQNTVGAMGIMPRTVETAVSMIGRKRELLASTAASQGPLPCARSASIWLMRITAFLLIMPSKNRTRRIVTRCRASHGGGDATTTPIIQSGATLTTISNGGKL